MDEDRMIDVGGMKVVAAGDITHQELFEIDQNMARGQEYVEAMVDILAETLVEHRSAHGFGTHPGMHLATEEFLHLVEALDHNQARGLLQVACWMLAEQAVGVAEKQVMFEQFMDFMRNHECGPDCEDEGHDPL